MEHVDEADDLLVGVPDGGGHGGDVLAEPLPQGLEGGVVVGVVLVGLGDIEHPGQLALLAQLPGLLGAHAHAALGGADDDGGVGDLQGLDDLAGEVEVARGIQHIDLAAVVLHRSHRGGDGNLAANLLGVVITNGVAVDGASQPYGSAGQIQHALRQGGLSVATVSQQAYVADVLYGIAHNLFPLLTFGIAEQCGKLLLSIIHELERTYNKKFRKIAQNPPENQKSAGRKPALFPNIQGWVISLPSRGTV